MQNLKLDRKSWEYRHIGPPVTSEDMRGFREGSVYHEALEIEFDYDRAGINYFSGSTYPGGIYAKFRRVRVEMSNGVVVSTMFTIDACKDLDKKGFSVLLIPLERGNPARLKQVAEFFDPIIPELGKMWFEESARAVYARFKDACASFQKNHKLGSTMIWPKQEVQPEPAAEAVAV